MTDLDLAGLDRAEPDVHVYLSTACLHDRHGECRRTCKFCTSECYCSCHEAGDPA